MKLQFFKKKSSQVSIQDLSVLPVLFKRRTITPHDVDYMLDLIDIIGKNIDIILSGLITDQAICDQLCFGSKDIVYWVTYHLKDWGFADQYPPIPLPEKKVSYHHCKRMLENYNAAVLNARYKAAN